MLAYALLRLSIEIRIGARRLVGIAHVNVHDRCPRVVGRVGRFDLFRGRDRYRRVVFLARQGAGDGNGNDDGRSHDVLQVRRQLNNDSSKRCWQRGRYRQTRTGAALRNDSVSTSWSNVSDSALAARLNAGRYSTPFLSVI